MAERNLLYYGDNLHILNHYFADRSVDLIYLDPPFNSNRSYNVLFKESTGAASEAQIEAFEDSWNWAGAAATFDEIQMNGPPVIARLMKSLLEGIGHNDVTAYLTMMAIRLVELRRVLKETGSIYLHCDPTAGPYLRVLMDTIFGPQNFVNEIVWKRFSSHGNVYKAYGKVHDTILFYRLSDKATWHQLYRPLSEKYIASFFTHVDEQGRRYRLQNVLNPNKDRPNLTYDWNGHTRVWKWTRDRMQQLQDSGLLEYSKTGLLKGFRQYLDESLGEKLQDVWDDIRPLGQTDDRDLGYNTQKPIALLERIIESSSNPGDIVLDPFCGCGTAIDAAEKLGRRWLGIDVTHLAINVMRRRMQDRYPGIEFEVIGEPQDVAGARELASKDKYQFQWWALDQIDAQPTAGKKKGSDRGIDGVIPYFANPQEGFKRVVVSVKGGEQINPAMIRDLKGVLDREEEAIGLFLTLRAPTAEMRTEAAAAGFFHSDYWQKSYPRIQILTIDDLFSGKRPDHPPKQRAYAEAEAEKRPAPQLRFPDPE
jgi:site-specific DNA-methyltransferase (adenine-specific)